MFPLAALWWFCLKIKGELGQLGSYWNFPSLCFKITVPQKQLHSKRASLTLKKCLGNTVTRQTHHLFVIFFLHWKSIYITRRPSFACMSFSCIPLNTRKCAWIPQEMNAILFSTLIANRLRLCCHDPIPALRSKTMYCILITRLNLTFNLCPYWDRMFFRIYTSLSSSKFWELKDECLATYHFSFFQQLFWATMRGTEEDSRSTGILFLPQWISRQRWLTCLINMQRSQCHLCSFSGSVFPLSLLIPL